MLFSLTSRIVSALVAFIYPGYASYKTLSQRPASEAELERWLMYWSVLGCIVGVETLAEWLISWIPFYSTFKMIFLLYLALPQTQGATYIYLVHLRPFFASHERQIDATIAEIRGRAYRFVQEKARALWAAVLSALAPGAAGGQEFTPGSDAQPAGQPRAPGTSEQGPAQLLSSLWTSYGPGIIAGGATLLRQSAAATLPAGTPGLGSTAYSANISAEERRRQLEAELASLAPYSSTSSVPIPPANNPARPSFTPSSSGSSVNVVRERTISGKFEEIRGGEVEGYEVDEDFVGGFVKTEGSNKGGRSSGWFAGWGSTSASAQGYEKVKDKDE